MKKFIAKRGKRIGKLVMNCLYIHKSALDTLLDDEKELVYEKIKYLSEDFVFDIIKIDMKNNTVSFTQSLDWDTSDEPEVGARITVKSDNSIIKRKKSTLIYHHKWAFVKDSYTGFDVEQSKKRSEYWENHPSIIALKEDKDEKFFFKIGQKKYWEEKVRSVIDK